MRKVSVFYLKPGDRLSRPILGSEGEFLLRRGVILKSNYIQKLIRLGIPSVYVADGLLSDIEIEDVISLETRRIAINYLKHIMLESKKYGRLLVDPGIMGEVVNKIKNDLLRQKTLMQNLVDLRAQDDYTFAHSVNVCVLALITGITLGYSDEQLTILGKGALLHDLGKIKIPDRILNKPAKLTEDEFTEIKNHPTYSYELIKAAKGMDLVALIALQHHESYDGSGYPRGIKGDEFHEYAQIVSIADKFDALTAERIYRKAFLPHEAYEMCAACGDFVIDNRIVKAFLQNIAAYPSGEFVKLTNGYVAVVLDTPKGYSMFPRVRLLFDSKGHLLDPFHEVALAEEKGLAVVRVLSEEEIRDLQYSPAGFQRFGKL